MTPRELDALVLPRAAAALRALLDRVAERRAGLRRRPVGLLGRLDDRFAVRGPLRLLRDVPQIGVAAAALLLVAGTGVAVSQHDGGTSVQPASAVGAPAPALALGPPVGADAESHLAVAAERVVDLAESDPRARHLALVSLRSGLTPEQTGALLDRTGLVLERAYLLADVPGRPEQVLFQTPGDVVVGLQEVFRATALRKIEEQRDLLATAAALGAAPGATGAAAVEQQREVAASYEQEAGTAGAEAAAYSAGCACVFALVVNGGVASLRGLLDLPEVRGVEAAPRGAAVTALSVRPLRPAETGTVGEGAP